MFSRRHPYLFFILIFSSICGAAIIAMSLLFVISSKTTEFEFGEKVGVIEITGVISNPKNVIQKIKRFRTDDSIKAIVLRIDSPGGGVGPSQEIYREVRKTIGTKKVVASMGAVAASGGYYVAAGTDGIMANPGTITGSIGVIMGFTNFEAVLRKIGLVPVVVKSREFKDIGSPVRKMSDSEQNILQGLVNKIHNQFVRDVAEGRNLDPVKIEALADGRIYTGEEAKALGLVDRLGNLEDSIEWAGRMGGIKGEINTVYARDEKPSLLQYLMGASFKELANRIVNPHLYAGYLYSP